MVKEDVIKANMQFFTDSWMLPNYNSNIVVLILKSQDAERVDEYKPIAMANVKYKLSLSYWLTC